jgi:hypothetical protein
MMRLPNGFFWPHVVLALALASSLAACGSNPDAGQYVGDSITATDFDNLAGWGADPNGLSRDHAHSGRFSTFISPEREYSLTYNLPLRDASVHTIKAVEVDAWVYLPSDQAKASLTVQVVRPVPAGGTTAASLSNEPLHLLDQVHKFGKWQPVHQVFVLPPNLPADSELRIFMWRDASSEPVYLDDLTVKARE